MNQQLSHLDAREYWRKEYQSVIQENFYLLFHVRASIGNHFFPYMMINVIVDLLKEEHLKRA